MTLRSLPLRAATALLALGLGAAAPQAPMPAAAAGHPENFARWNLRTFTDRDGLPQNSIHAMTWGPDGRLWVGTQDGLAAYDGHAWKLSQPPSLDHSGARIFGLLDASDGSLWAGSMGGGAFRLKEGRWTSFGPQEGLQGRLIHAFLELGEGPDAGLWAATDRGVFRFDGQRWQNGDPANELPKETLVCMARLPDGSLVAGGYAGLYRRVEGRWTRVAGSPKELVTCLVVEPRGEGWTLWAGTRSLGLCSWDGRAWRGYGREQGLPGIDVERMLLDSRGRLWAISFNHGLYRRDGEHFTGVVLPETGLPSPQLMTLLANPGPTRQLWIGTEGGGLARLQLGAWRSFGKAQGLPTSATFSLLQRKDGSYWAGTMDGLARWDGARWVQVPLPPKLEHKVVLSLREDGPDLWVGTNAGLARLQGRNWSVFSAPDSFKDNTIRFVRRAGGQLWAGNDEGLSVFDGKRWTPFTIPDFKDQPVAMDLAEWQGELYLAGYDEGLEMRDRAGRWSELKLPQRCSVLSLRVREAAGRAQLWVGTRQGLFWRELGDPKAPWSHLGEDTIPALPNGVINGMQWDAEGRLYAFTNRGAARLTPDPAAPGGWRQLVLGLEDGLPSAEAITSSDAVDDTGHIWVGTSEGLAVLDPSEDPGPPPPAPLPLRAEGLDGAALAPGARLASKARGLRFRFPLGSFFREGETRYRTQMLGLEEQPTDWGPEPEREFPSLPSGDFTFRVWARDYAGTLSGPVDFRFHMAPPFWLSPWAFLAYAAALVGGGLGLGRWRSRHLRARAEELERTVAQRTAELQETQERLGEAHDHLLRLGQSGANAAEDLESWARKMADEVAASIGVGPIAVWEFRGSDPVLLSGSQELKPSLDAAVTMETQPPLDASGWTIPAAGPSGEPCAALVLPAPGRELGPAERRLLASLAQQVGGAVEMARLRRSLHDAEERQRVSHQDLHERGIDTLWICPTCHSCYDQSAQTCPADGSKLEAPRVLPYRIHGRYRMLRRLGEGGMGTILLAEDERLGREVAIKLIHAERFMKPEARLRFEREARTVAKIHHPRVIAIYDSGELDDGSAFIVMEHLKGGDLSQLIQAAGPGTPAQVALLLRQSAAALQAAHSAGIVHRDIKPGNIFLTDGPGGGLPFLAKVLDFGLAKSMDLDRELTQAGTVVGTPYYMAPEQLQGAAADPRTDLYALATVAFEALTGQRPIGGDNLAELMSNILRKEPPPLSSFLPDTTPLVDAAFTLALAKSPEVRNLGVEEWVDSFAGELAAMPSQVPGWPSPIPEFAPQMPGPSGSEPTADGSSTKAGFAARKEH